MIPLQHLASAGPTPSSCPGLGTGCQQPRRCPRSTCTLEGMGWPPGPNLAPVLRLAVPCAPEAMKVLVTHKKRCPGESWGAPAAPETAGEQEAQPTSEGAGRAPVAGISHGSKGRASGDVGTDSALP